MKYTKGPWVYDENFRLKEKYYHQITAGSGFHEENTNSGFSIAGYMSEGDARLIAKAPEMYELLKETANCEHPAANYQREPSLAERARKLVAEISNHDCPKVPDEIVFLKGVAGLSLKIMPNRVLSFCEDDPLIFKHYTNFNTPVPCHLEPCKREDLRPGDWAFGTNDFEGDEDFTDISFYYLVANEKLCWYWDHDKGTNDMMLTTLTCDMARWWKVVADE